MRCAPDDLDVALAMERVSEVTTLPLRSVRSTWAGLRTFSPDGDMVLRPRPLEPGSSGAWARAATASSRRLP